VSDESNAKFPYSLIFCVEIKRGLGQYVFLALDGGSFTERPSCGRSWHCPFPGTPTVTACSEIQKAAATASLSAAARADSAARLDVLRLSEGLPSTSPSSSHHAGLLFAQFPSQSGAFCAALPVTCPALLLPAAAVEDLAKAGIFRLDASNITSLAISRPPWAGPRTSEGDTIDAFVAGPSERRSTWITGVIARGSVHAALMRINTGAG
jgi:hypothetical protein